MCRRVLMLDEDKEYRVLERIAQLIYSKPYCADFHEPVLANHPELEEMYLKVIDQPMDLGTITKKIKKKEYKSYQECGRDIVLVFMNSLAFNAQIPTLVAISSHALLYSERLWENIFHTPMQSSRQQPKHQTDIALYRSCRDMKVTSKEIRRIANVVKDMTKNEIEFLNNSRDTILSQYMNRVAEFLLNEFEGSNQASSNTEFHCAFLEVELEEEWENIASAVSGNMLLLTSLARVDRVVGEICVHLMERETRGFPMSSIWGRPYKLVWAQPNRSPWWPGMILAGHDVPKYLETVNLSRIPSQIMSALTRLRPKSKVESDSSQFTPPNMYIVEFFGPTHDFGWVKSDSVVEYFALEDGSTPIDMSPDQLTHDSTALTQALDAYSILSNIEFEISDEETCCVLDSYIFETISFRTSTPPPAPSLDIKPRKRKPRQLAAPPRDGVSKRELALEQARKYSNHLQTVRPIIAVTQTAVDRPVETSVEVQNVPSQVELPPPSLETIQSTPPRKKRRRKIPLLVDENTSKFLSSEYLTAYEQALAVFQGCARLIKYNRAVKYTNCPILHGREINFGDRVFFLESKSRNIRKQKLKAEIALLSKELQILEATQPECLDETNPRDGLNSKTPYYPKANVSRIQVGLAGRLAKRAAKPALVTPPPEQTGPQPSETSSHLKEAQHDLAATPSPQANASSSSLAMRMMPFSFG